MRRTSMIRMSITAGGSIRAQSAPATDMSRTWLRMDAFELGDDMVWLDCFVPDETGREDAEVYARSMFDSIARTVRPSAEEGPK